MEAKGNLSDSLNTILSIFFSRFYGFFLNILSKYLIAVKTKTVLKSLASSPVIHCLKKASQQQTPECTGERSYLHKILRHIKRRASDDDSFCCLSLKKLLRKKYAVDGERNVCTELWWHRKAS